MSTIQANAILDASGGNTTTVNSVTPNADTVKGRNLIINGAMQVAQRGTSFNFAHDGTKFAYTLDRFYCITGGSYSEWDCVVTQDSDSPSGFSSCLKLTTGTAEASVGADEYYYLQQRIEAQSLQHLDFGSSTAKKLTLSFWIKSSITGTYAVMFYKQDSVRVINTTYTIDSANTWEYKTITIDGDTTGAIANDNGQGLTIYWGFASGTDYNSTISSSWAAYANTNLLGGQTANGVVTTAGATFQLTGVKLEVGSVATEFDHRSYGEELSLCQRYYYQIGPHSSSQRFGIDGLYSNGTGAGLNAMFTHPTIMRASPTLTAGAGFPGTTTFSNSEQYIFMTTGGHAVGRVSCEISSGTTTVDAEL